MCTMSLSLRRRRYHTKPGGTGCSRSGISSEWSGTWNGRIDFRVVGPAWGIELIRNGDKLKEHCSI
jgi:hypothetical protein